MPNLLIAVALCDDGTLSPHAGRALHWQVYASTEDNKPVLAWELNLTDTGCLHEWHVRADNSRHPLHSVDIAIAGSGGAGVTRRLAERDTQLIGTAEKSPYQAVTDYLAGTLAPGRPHSEEECLDPEHHKTVMENSV